MLKVGKWMEEADKYRAFLHWAQDIRMRQRAKRHLMQLMNENDL